MIRKRARNEVEVSGKRGDDSIQSTLWLGKEERNCLVQVYYVIKTGERHIRI